MLQFLCTALLLNEIYLPIKFLVDIFVVSELCTRQRSKYNNEQRAITPNLSMQSHSSYALHFGNEIYKFLVDHLCSFRVISHTRCGHTYGRTKRRIYAVPSGRITNKRAQRALGRSPEEKVKGQGEAIILL